MNLLEELRRRNVFRVAAAYAVVTWLLLRGLIVLPAAGRQKHNENSQGENS